MAFDYDSFTFHFSSYDEEIAISLHHLTPVQYSAFVATSAAFLIHNHQTFMNSKEAALQVIKMFRGIIKNEFPPTLPPAIPLISGEEKSSLG